MTDRDPEALPAIEPAVREMAILIFDASMAEARAALGSFGPTLAALADALGVNEFDKLPAGTQDNWIAMGRAAYDKTKAAEERATLADQELAIARHKREVTVGELESERSAHEKTKAELDAARKVVEVVRQTAETVSFWPLLKKAVALYDASRPTPPTDTTAKETTHERQ